MPEHSTSAPDTPGADRPPGADRTPGADQPSLPRRPTVPLRAITLDLDDTLWPVAPTLVAAEQQLSDWLHAHTPRTAGYLSPDVRAALRKQVLADHADRAHDLGFVRRELIRRALAAAGDDEAHADAAFAVFLAARQRVTFFDDVLPVLRDWSSRYRLIAISNGNADISSVGLGDLLHGAVSAHEMGCAKPDPRMFVEACRRAGVAPSEVLHIGDEPHLDVRAARAAGLRAVWIRRPEFAHRHPADACGSTGIDDDGGPFDSLHAIDAWLHGG